MSEELSLKATQEEYHGSVKSYLIGFGSCIILTTLSFALVMTRVFSGDALIYTVVALAGFQAIVQLLFFLHLGQEDKPRWETIIFLFMLLVLAIIVLGTLWIMFDLNERVMSGMNM